MGFDIVRLVVSSWPQAMEALRAKGVDFYRGHHRTNGDPALPAFATKFSGALTLGPASRDLDASSWYQALQPRLPPDARRTCDEHFGALFWNGEEDARLAVLGAAGLPTDQSDWKWLLWNALDPPGVEAQLALARKLPLAALAAAAAEGGPVALTYLPTFEDFAAHLGHHRDLLEHAQARKAGLLSLASY
jgi:hypothetical protein